MTAYHALHESPYDDACPDCTGFGDPEDYYRESRSRSSLIAALCLIALCALIAWKGYRP